jgi:hypothetical protein
VLIAANVADLHGDIERDRNLINQRTALMEKRAMVNGNIRPEGSDSEHDMLTGSDSHGRAFPPRRGIHRMRRWGARSRNSSPRGVAAVLLLRGGLK